MKQHKQKKRRKPSNFLVNSNGVFKVSIDGSRTRISNYMEITRIEHNIDTGEYQSEIEFDAFDVKKRALVSRKDYLQKKGLLDLQALGLDVTPTNAGTLISFLREEEDQKIDTCMNVHTSLGYGLYSGKPIFKLHEAIGIKSKYVGPYQISPVGSFQEYLQMLKDEIKGNVALETILAASTSSILLGYIGESLNLDSTIIHLVGNSTTGKSTALKLAISVFGNPHSQSNSLYGTYNGTNNALHHKLTGLNGVPYALDEISISDTKNYTSFIYTTANGSEKERLTKESVLMTKKTWRTTVFSNGERSLTGSANKNAGIQVRVIEIKNMMWTKSAQNAENIQRTILKTHGHLGFSFASHIMKMDPKEITQRYKGLRKKIFDKITSTVGSDTFVERRSAKYAMILLAGELLKDILGFELQINQMIRFFADIEKESMKYRNFKESVVDFIKDYISLHLNQFSLGKNFMTGGLGRIIQKSKSVEVEMNKTAFKNMLDEGDFEDPEIVLKELKASKQLNCESDRYTRTRKNQFGYSEEVYVLVLNDMNIDLNDKKIP